MFYIEDDVEYDAPIVVVHIHTLINKAQLLLASLLS